MKVTFINRDHTLWEGGDKNKVINTISALKKLGINAYYVSDPTLSIDSDLFHLIHVSYPHSLLALDVASESRIPLVVSTVYSGEKLSRNAQQKVLDYSSRVVFTSKGEKNYVTDILRIDNRKSRIISNGVSSLFDQSPLLGETVLCVGRIYPQKNQLLLAVACQNLGLPLLCIGDVVDKKYAKEIRRVGARLLPSMPQSSLVNYYKKANVCACVSKHEVHPNVVLEGGMCGSNILLTSHSCSFVEGLPNVWVCDPDIKSIRFALSGAWNAARNDNLRNVLRPYTWELVAAQLRVLYFEVLDNNSAKRCVVESNISEEG